MNETMWVFVAALFAFTLVAAISDARTKKLPNWLTVPGFLAGLVYQGVTGGWEGLGTAFAGFAIGFGVLLVLWLVGGGGGGDVKLMGALGAWLGPVPILLVFFLSGLFIMVGAAGRLVWELATHGYAHARRKFLPALATQHKTTLTAEQRQALKQKRRLMPYAVPVALGTWVFLAWKIVSISATGAGG